MASSTFFNRLFISQRHSRIRNGFFFLMSNFFSILGIIILVETLLLLAGLAGFHLPVPGTIREMLVNIVFFDIPFLSHP